MSNEHSSAAARVEELEAALRELHWEVALLGAEKWTYRLGLAAGRALAALSPSASPPPAEAPRPASRYCAGCGILMSIAHPPPAPQPEGGKEEA